MSYLITKRCSCLYHSREWDRLLALGYITKRVDKHPTTGDEIAQMIKQETCDGQDCTQTPNRSGQCLNSGL